VIHGGWRNIKGFLGSGGGAGKGVLESNCRWISEKESGSRSRRRLNEGLLTDGEGDCERGRATRSRVGREETKVRKGTSLGLDARSGSRQTTELCQRIHIMWMGAWGMGGERRRGKTGVYAREAAVYDSREWVVISQEKGAY